MFRELFTLFFQKLKLKGVDAENTKVSDEVLAEMFEINEAIDECKSLETLKHLLASLHKTIDEIKKTVDLCYNCSDFEGMAIAVQRMKYYTKAVENVEVAQNGLTLSD